MDEPALGPGPRLHPAHRGARRGAEDHYTVIIVTHNMQQAARVADWTMFMLFGEIVESGPTDKIFTSPDDQRTEDYVTGRFG